MLTRQSSYSSSSSDLSNASSAGASDFSDGGDDDEDGDIGMDTVQGLSTADIGSLMYGEVSKDRATFDSAVSPLLDQVLHMLLERGKVGSRLVGPDNVRHWFATVQPV